MFHFDFTATDSTHDMVMVLASDLIGEMAVPGMGGMHQSVLCKKLERAIDSRFRETGQLLAGLFIDFGRREMRPNMMKHMQDRHSLGCHSITARTQLRSILGSTGHIYPYCKFLQ